MKDKFDKKKQKISMADDEETASNKFPEPVSRGFAFDEAFFEGDFEEASEPSAPMAVIESADEETELAYDFGMFGSSNHSSAVYRPKAPTPSKPEETESQPHFSIQSEPQEAFASDLFESINEELTHMEAEPLAYEPLAQGTQPQKKETFSYDEFRARFTAPQEEPEPTPEPMHEEPAPPVGFSLDSSAQWNEGDDLHEELPDTNRIDLQEEFFIQPEPEAPTEPEPQLTEEPQKEPEEAPLLSASAMNILLDTEADNEALEETIARYSDEEKDDEEDSFHSLSLEKVANEQQAEYFAEGEEPEPLTAPYSPRSGNFFTRNVIPQKGDSPAEIIRKIIMILALLAVIGSAGYLFNDYVITPYRTANQIDELSEMIDESNMDVVGDNLKKEYPGVDFPEGMLEKYASLYARNSDFVGWLSIDALDISLPVVKGENNSKYLKTDFDGKKNKYGSLFVNASNNIDRLDMNTTIFGHNMKDSKMLGNLVYYRTVKGYQKAPVIEFNTIYADYKWKIFAVMLTNGEASGDRNYLFNYMFTNLSSETALEEYLGEVKQRSLYYPEVDIALTDKLLTISTCTYDFDDARLVILARMVRPGESTSVSGTVYGNENPRYPQAYYDKQNLNNPYFYANRWLPS